MTVPATASPSNTLIGDSRPRVACRPCTDRTAHPATHRLQGEHARSLSALRYLCVADPEPGPLTVIDLQGRCAHADGFGPLDQLTLEQEWQLIEAALDAASGEGS